MGNNIRTYQDLMEEKSRLRGTLAVKKQSIKNNIAGIKQSLKPASVAYSVASRFFKRGSRNPLLHIITQIITDFVLRKTVRHKMSKMKFRVLEILIANFIANTLRPYVNRVGRMVLDKLRPHRPTPAALPQY